MSADTADQRAETAYTVGFAEGHEQGIVDTIEALMAVMVVTGRRNVVIPKRTLEEIQDLELVSHHDPANDTWHYTLNPRMETA